MDILLTLTAILALIISVFCFAAFIMLLAELGACKRHLKEQVDEFAGITKAASEANVTHAQKMIQLEERVVAAEQKVAFFNAAHQETQKPWGGR